MPSVQEIEKIVNKFNEPFFKTEDKPYYVQSYVGIRPSNLSDDKFEIFFIENDIQELVRAKLICFLFKILNELKIVPSEINYVIPDNTCNPEYFSYPITPEELGFIPMGNEYDASKFKLPAEKYYEYYNKRYYKYPLVPGGHKFYDVEFKYVWVHGIVI
jgi:hypothetical protein